LYDCERSFDTRISTRRRQILALMSMPGSAFRSSSSGGAIRAPPAPATPSAPCRRRRRRSRLLLPQRTEQKRWSLRDGLKPVLHSSQLLSVTDVHRCGNPSRHDEPRRVLTVKTLDARGVRGGWVHGRPATTAASVSTLGVGKMRRTAE
jgi:hypothetical protein